MEKKLRLQIDFGEEGYRELEELQKQLGAPSKSEVVRDALGVLRWVASEVRNKDTQILVKRKGEEPKEVVFHFIKQPVAEEKGSFI